MSNRGDIVKAHFATINARTRFYKARTRLGPNNNIWMNDDLTKQQETLAYQATQLYQTGKIFRTWTYMNSVFIQRLPTDNAVKVIDNRSLQLGAADSMGNIIQLYNLVPSRNRVFLPGMNPGNRDFSIPIRQQLQSQLPLNQSIPGGQYQPLIPNLTEEEYRNRRRSGQNMQHGTMDNRNMN